MVARLRETSLIRLIREVNPVAIDLALSLVLTGAALATLVSRPDAGGDFRSDDLIGGILVLLQTLPLALRRIAPLGVLAIITSGLLAHSALGYEVVQIGTFSSLVALYGAAAWSDNRGGLVAAAISAFAIAAFFVTNRGEWAVLDIASVGGTWAIAWVAGTFVRVRGEQVEAAGARAVRLELERDLHAREAVADERARMARELHDIVGHALNVIVIQAAGAHRVFDTRPEVTRDALTSIESAGREALVDMERMLAVMRAAGAGDNVAGSLTGLAQMDGLISHVAEAGLQVDIMVEGEPRDLPASVDLSAFRIIQESLTNCLKHSGASRATVTIRFGSADLEVEVTDNGRGAFAKEDQAEHGGRGHLGMKERVAMFGGDLSIGTPSQGSGYRVWARLPFEGRTSA